jgi:hypothetical protein
MQIHGHVDYVWSTDTDLLVHGATKVILDWDWRWNTGGVIVYSNDLFNSEATEMLKIFKQHGIAALRLLAICSCDYFSIHGVGVSTWIKLMHELQSADLDGLVALLKQKVTEKAPGFKSSRTVAQVQEESFLLKTRVAISCFEDALAYDIDAHAVVSLSGIDPKDKLWYLSAHQGDGMMVGEELKRHVTGALSCKTHKETDIAPVLMGDVAMAEHVDGSLSEDDEPTEGNTPDATLPHADVNANTATQLEVCACVRVCARACVRVP